MQVGLLLIVASSLLLLTLDFFTSFLAIVMIVNGIVALHISPLKLVKRWRTSTVLSMICMLVTTIALLATAILTFPKADFEVLLSCLVHLPVAPLIFLWVRVLVGLVLLRRSLSEVYNGATSRLVLMLIIGWTLTPIIVGLLVFLITLVLLAARICEARSINNKPLLP